MRTHMDGYEYEYECAKLLKRRGFSRINVTRGSGDQGIDILAFKEGKSYGIQCKYYSHPVGNKAVQEAFAGAKFYDCDIAAVLTNNTFTPSARELAQKTGVILWDSNIVPRSMGFRITKWIGAFMCLAGLLGFFAINGVRQIEDPFLHQVYFGLLFAGGMFNFFECGFAVMEMIACVCYTMAIMLSALIKLSTDSNISNTFVIMLAALAFSLVRAFYLRKIKRRQV